jgi:alkylation response protein AidB-like acyl-CoA dehydrogenase
MAGTAPGPSLLEAVNGIAPIIRKNAAAAERDRRLSREAFEAMRQAGLYRMCKPRARGGLETDPVTALRVFEEVARLHPAAAWNMHISVAGYQLVAWLPDDGAAELLAEPDTSLAGSFSPPGKAVACDGGYAVTGRWSFGSGGHQAEWLGGGALIYDPGSEEPRKDEHGHPVMLLILVPAADVTIHDNWNTMGMRGTGSHDFSVDRAFVPAHRTGELAPLTKLPAACSAPIYRLSLWFMVAGLAAPPLGAARAAIDALVELANKKTPNYTVSTLAQRSVAQMQVARAEALVGAARAYLYDTVGDAWQTALQGRFLDQDQKVRIQLAACHAVRSAAEAVDLVHEAAGTSGIKQEQPFEACFRDVHAMTQHAFSSAARFESAGKLLFGQPSDWPFFAL